MKGKEWSFGLEFFFWEFQSEKHLSLSLTRVFYLILPYLISSFGKGNK